MFKKLKGAVINQETGPRFSRLWRFLASPFGYFGGIGALAILVLAFNLFFPFHSARGFVFGLNSFSPNSRWTQDSPSDYSRITFWRNFSRSFLEPRLDGQGGAEEIFGLPIMTGNTLLGYSSPAGGFSGPSLRNEITNYTVQSGDNPSVIAAGFGITVRSLLWANNLYEWSIIKPGQELIIPPVSGVLHKVKSGDTVSGLAQKYKGNAEEIIAFNDLPADGSLEVGDTVVIPGGEIPSSPKVSGSPSRSSSLPSLDGYFVWPLETNRGLTRKNLHGYNGVDMKASCGTPIYAAASGVVSIADGTGWNGGYGKYVVIQHPNGTQTLYSHASQVLISAGAGVSQGQAIALAGTTGRSSGCHLHFEVRGAKNPFVTR